MKYLLLLSLLTACNFDGTKTPINKYFSKICIEGHEYYKSAAYGYLAINLNANGKPIKCGVNK